MDTNDRMKQALAVAGQQVAMMVCNLAERIACQPTLWAFDGKTVQMTYLAVPDSGRAQAMARKLIAGPHAAAVSVSTVMDVYRTDSTTGKRTDALLVTVYLPGTDVEIALVLPYEASGPRFERGFELVSVRGVDLDPPAIRSAFFMNFENASRIEGPDSVLARLPRTLTVYTAA